VESEEYGQRGLGEWHEGSGSSGRGGMGRGRWVEMLEDEIEMGRDELILTEIIAVTVFRSTG
jgi:hypothetical protein